jgi:hypothetical protein
VTYSRADVAGLVALALAGVVILSPSGPGAAAVVALVAGAGWLASLEHETLRRTLATEATLARMGALAGELTSATARLEDVSNRLVRLENRTRRPGE